MKEAKPASKSFEAALVELEKIVRELERGDLALDDSLKLFEKGVTLSKQCQERLQQAERRVEMLLQDADGQLTTTPLDNDGSGLPQSDDEES